jgi:hypothetical protein
LRCISYCDTYLSCLFIYLIFLLFYFTGLVFSINIVIISYYKNHAMYVLWCTRNSRTILFRIRNNNTQYTQRQVQLLFWYIFHNTMNYMQSFFCPAIVLCMLFWHHQQQYTRFIASASSVGLMGDWPVSGNQLQMFIRPLHAGLLAWLCFIFCTYWFTCSLYLLFWCMIECRVAFVLPLFCVCCFDIISSSIQDLLLLQERRDSKYQ